MMDTRLRDGLSDGEIAMDTSATTWVPPGRHDKERALTANLIDPRRYMVMWSATMRCFVRWTWCWPSHNERVA